MSCITSQAMRLGRRNLLTSLAKGNRQAGIERLNTYGGLRLAVSRPIVSTPLRLVLTADPCADRMPHEKRKGELRRADLPVEVWAMIAAHVSLRDWALASGTCRSTRAVRLKNLSLRNAPAAGVRWASRMLDGAEALCLSGEPLLQVAQDIACGSYTIENLQQLIIDAPQLSDAALSCLPLLLAQASKLEVLVTPARLMTLAPCTMPWFPSLANLKHLNLTFHRDFRKYCEAMPSCTGLETLSLRCNIPCHVVEMGDLKLDALLHLRVVVLKGIAPDSIKVPEACQLHVAIPSGTDLEPSVWQGVFSNIHSMDVTFCFEYAAALGLLLCQSVDPMPNLQILQMHLYRLQPHLELPWFDLKNFSPIKELHIWGEELALHLPAGVCWDALEVHATDMLVLDFEDMVGFTMAVPRFSASYGHMCGTKALEMCTVLAQSSISCAFREGRFGDSEFWYPAKQRHSVCCCGACLRCLAASGQAVKHVTEADLYRARNPLREYIPETEEYTVYVPNRTEVPQLADEKNGGEQE